MRACFARLPFLCPIASVADAQSYDALVDAKASTSTLELESELRTTGNLLGDFDATTNPSGTQTRLGLFGGSGNMPIPISLDVLSGSGGSSQPDGLFSLDLDLPGLSGSIAGLALDLAPGAGFPTNASARLSYQTFRTLSPSCTFLSVGAVTLPLGEIGQIRDITLVQTDSAALQLQATPDPERFDAAATVPALLSLVVETSLGGDPLPLSDLPVLLPLNGSLERSGPDRFEFRAVLASQTQDGGVDLGGAELPPIPFPFPCILPQGAEANLIFNLNADVLDFELTFGFELVAEAVERALVDLIFAHGFE